MQIVIHIIIYNNIHYKQLFASCLFFAFSSYTCQVIHNVNSKHNKVAIIILLMCVNAGAAECSDCPTGWLCLEGEELQLCPEGHYCLGGTVEDILPCPPGTYSPKAGQSQVEQCLLCSAGESSAPALLTPLAVLIALV